MKPTRGGRLKIVCWRSDDPDSHGEVNLVTTADLSLAREWISMGGTLSGRWFHVKNVDIREMEMFAWLVKSRFLATEDVEIVGVSPGVRAYFLAAEAAVAALSEWDVDAYATLRGVMTSLRAPSHLLRAALVFDLLDRFSASVAKTAVSGCWSAPSSSQWCAGVHDAVKEMVAVEQEMSKHKNSLGPLVELLSATVKRMRMGADWESKNEQHQAFLVSAYCYGLARHACRRGHALLGVMLVHRAMDLFLLSLCFGHGLASLSPAGPSYCAPDVGRDRVSMNNSYYYLEQGNVLARDKSRKEWLRELNDVRNLVLLAHGANGATVAWVDKALEKARIQAKNVLGHDRWGTVGESLFAAIPLSFSLVFDVEPGIDSYVEEVALR